MATPPVARKQPKSIEEDTEDSGSVLQTPFANLPFVRLLFPPAFLLLVRFLSSSDSEAMEMEPYTKRGWDKGSEDVVEDGNKTPRANAIAERSPTPFPRPLRPSKEDSDEEYFLAPNDHGACMEMRNLERIVNDQQLREGLDDLETLLSSMENTARQTSRKIEVIQQLRVGIKERFLDQTMRPFAKARLGRTPDSRTQRNERVGVKIGLEDELFGTGRVSYSSTAKFEASGGKACMKRQREAGDDTAKHGVYASASKRVKFSVG